MIKTTGNDQPKTRKKGPGFRFAWSGILYFFKSQQNARIHAMIRLAVIVLGLWLELSHTEWLLVIFCIGMVFGAELFNTAIELLTDLVSPDYHPKAGKVKDVAAAAVLISAITSAVIGLIIFMPKLVGIIIATGDPTY